MKLCKRLCFTALIVLVVLGTGCSLLPGAAKTPVATATLVPLPSATPLLLPPVATPTLVVLPSDTSVPTRVPTIAPTATAGSGPQRISFPPGGTSATVQGTAAANGGVTHYVLRVLAGQTMSVTLSSTQGQAILVISSADGNVLLSDHVGATQWKGTVPTAQDYLIDVRAVGTVAANYALQVTIPPLATPAPGSSAATQAPPSVPATSAPGSSAATAVPATSAPSGSAATAVPATSAPAATSAFGPTPVAKRISFPVGETMAIVQGSLPASGVDRYILRAQAGQTMTVTATTTQGEVILIIFGAEGTVLISDHADATTWSGPLPLTEDYIIDVRAGPAPANYALQVTIPPK